MQLRFINQALGLEEYAIAMEMAEHIEQTDTSKQAIVDRAINSQRVANHTAAYQERNRRARMHITAERRRR